MDVLFYKCEAYAQFEDYTGKFEYKLHGMRHFDVLHCHYTEEKDGWIRVQIHQHSPYGGTSFYIKKEDFDKLSVYLPYANNKSWRGVI